MVRSALAVRPCLPMTLPRSSSATLSSNTSASGSGDLLDLDLFGLVDEAARQVVDQIAQSRLSAASSAAALLGGVAHGR